MKLINLHSAQQKYLPAQERIWQKLCKIIPWLPILIAVLMVVAQFKNEPEYLYIAISTAAELVFVSFAFFFTLRYLKNKYIKRFTDEQLAKIEAECLSAPQYEGLMVTSEALMYFMPAILALPVQELVWVYPVATTYRKGLWSKTYYTIVAVTKDKKRHTLLRANRDSERMENSMLFLSEHLKELRPYVLLGYSEQLAAICKKEFNSMLQMADRGVGLNIDMSKLEDIRKPLEM